MSDPESKLFAPGTGQVGNLANRSYTSMVLPGASESELPHYNDHVVEPGTRQEMIDGKIVCVPPAHPPHADRHSEIDYVLRAHVASGYVASSDMLTRTSAKWNFAADASIRKRGVHPESKRRYLEELAFEIKSTQRAKDLTARARQLCGRGVRRVFGIWVEGDRHGIHVKNGPVKEWMPDEDRWLELDEDSYIEDPCLRRPIKVKALLDAIEADKAVIEALAAKGNPVLAQREAQSYERGKLDGIKKGVEKGMRQGLIDLCEAHSIELTAQRLARIEALDSQGLQALRQYIKQHHRWDSE